MMARKNLVKQNACKETLKNKTNIAYLQQGNKRLVNYNKKLLTVKFLFKNMLKQTTKGGVSAQVSGRNNNNYNKNKIQVLSKDCQTKILNNK